MYIVQSIEPVDSYELDIEAIYRRHSVEEMSVPIVCWAINFGCSINDNEFFYFLAPQQIAQYWMNGLEKVSYCINIHSGICSLQAQVVYHIREQSHYPDRRVMWLKKLYLQLQNDQENREFLPLINYNSNVYGQSNNSINGCNYYKNMNGFEKNQNIVSGKGRLGPIFNANSLQV